MKTISRKLVAVKASPVFINVSLSLASIAVIAVMLYVLINSPA